MRCQSWIKLWKTQNKRMTMRIMATRKNYGEMLCLKKWVCRRSKNSITITTKTIWCISMVQRCQKSNLSKNLCKKESKTWSKEKWLWLRSLRPLSKSRDKPIAPSRIWFKLDMATMVNAMSSKERSRVIYYLITTTSYQVNWILLQYRAAILQLQRYIWITKKKAKVL